MTVALAIFLILAGLIGLGVAACFVDVADVVVIGVDDVNENYDVVQVAKSANVWVCARCAAVTLRPTEHDAWHDNLGDALRKLHRYIEILDPTAPK